MLPNLLCSTLLLSLVGSLTAQDTPKPAKPKPVLQLPLVAGATTTTPKGAVFGFEIRADGSCWVEGKQTTTPELFARIRNEASRFPDVKRNKKGFKVSRLELVARLHADLPFEAVMRLQQYCASPKVAVDRIYLAVRAKPKGPERVVPFFIPTDTGNNAAKSLRTVRLSTTATPTGAKQLTKVFGDAARASGKGPKPAILFRPEAHTNLEGLLRVVHTAQAAGFDQCWFSATSSNYPAWHRGDKDFAKLAAANPRPRHKAPQVRLGGVELAEEEVIEEEEEVEEEEVEEEEESKPGKGKPSKFDAGAWSTPSPKERVAKRRGRNASPIKHGLAWLAAHQDKDGRWDADGFMKHDRDPKSTGKGKATHDVGLTGLALLAFLGDGNTLRSGPYKDQVKRGVIWLRTQQDQSGLFGSNATQDFIYDHAVATLAMCEAYGLSMYKTLRRNAQNGINYLERHRNPFAAWRYSPAGGDNDVSVTSWALMAYLSGTHFKLNVNRGGILAASRYLDSNTDPQTGLVGYTRRGERSARNPGDHAVRFPPDRGEAMTAAALFARQMMGQKLVNKQVMRKAANRLRAKLPEWNQAKGTIDFYYWYYGTYAMYQVGGEAWDTWDKALSDALVPKQRQDGSFRGSWNPVGVWGESGGRIYATAMATLSLQAGYRYRRVKNR